MPAIPLSKFAERLRRTKGFKKFGIWIRRKPYTRGGNLIEVRSLNESSFTFPTEAGWLQEINYRRYRVTGVKLRLLGGVVIETETPSFSELFFDTVAQTLDRGQP